ncbi:MAG TPA: Rieske 2Fe-2S domain-containing protein [Lacipirellulaceae bacterium]|jgi:Rieske Fe-S protein|nr:Rieske 2Fe-2S domain-containing protein [Lacipirellulaceae bacterium]
MIRRVFLGYGLMLLGFGRWAWAQIAEPSLRYAPLSHPIRIPLDTVSTPWQPALFTAEAMAPATAKTTTRRVLISGVVLRRPEPASEPLSALCLTCPHEQCKVDLITDLTRLAKLTGGTVTHPLFECGCHASVFDPLQNGARVSGETPRGLYRFRISGISDGIVEINEVEEIALFEV